MIRHFVIFGASGDLTARYLMPTLVNLRQAEKLGAGLGVLGIAPEDWDTAFFRAYIAAKLQVHAPEAVETWMNDLSARVEYQRADVTKREEIQNALSSVSEPAVFYFALPPAVLAPAARSILAARVPEGSRVILEKPFGTDLQSTRAVNQILHQGFSERAIFRMDHFLGKQTVQNILGLRLANRIFEPLWNSQHIEKVKIVWDETLTIEDRAGFYDQTGALRDMVQNHLLQLLCLIGMEPPPTLDEADLRSYKVALLRAVRRLSPEEIRQHTVRARYAAGRIGTRDIAAYRSEPRIDPRRQTETFAQITLWIDNWRWAGVPFVLRSGKALGQDRREIAVHFKSVPHLAFGVESSPRTNVLRLELNPDRMALGVNINGPGDPFDLEYIELDQALAPQEVSAYGRLILDALRGDLTLSIRDDEAEESWRIVEPILKAWTERQAPLLEYAAGSAGPERG